MIPIKIISLICKPGKFGQWIAAISVSLCVLSCSLGFAWPSAVLPKFRKGQVGFHLDPNEQSIIISILFYSSLIFPIPSAYMMEYVGRKNSLCIAIWFHVIAFAMISTLEGFWPLCLARGLSGFWVGLAYTVVPVYLAECSDPKIRGTLSTLYGVFFYIGSLSINFIGSYLSYQMTAVIPAIFTAILAVLICFIPESPYYYVAKGNIDAARSSLIWLRGYCDETVLLSIQDSVKKKQIQNSSFYDIIRNAAARRGFIIAQLIGTVQRTSGLAMLLSFTSVIMPDYIVTAANFAVILNVVWILSCIASSFVMDRFGRRTMMGFSCIGSCVTMFGISLWFFLRDQMSVDVSSTIWLPFILMIFHGITYSFGLVTIPTMMPGELFSPEIKSKASSLVTMWTCLVSGLFIQVFIPIESSVGVFMNFLICSISSFIGLFIAIFVMIETNGRSLEEIQQDLEGSKTIKAYNNNSQFQEKI